MKIQFEAVVAIKVQFAAVEAIRVELELEVDLEMVEVVVVVECVSAFVSDSVFDLVVVASVVDFAFYRLKLVGRIETVRISKLERVYWNHSSGIFFEDILLAFHILCSRQCRILGNSPF